MFRAWARRPLTWIAVLSVASVAAALIAPGLLLSYSVDDRSFYDGVSDMSAFDASQSAGVALDSQGGVRLATDGTPTVSTWSAPNDFLGKTGVGTLEGLLTAEATGNDAATGSLALRQTPLALDNDAGNPVLESVASTTTRLDSYEVQGPSVVKVASNDYRMYYTGVSSDGYRQRIFEAGSTNGTTWTKVAGPGPGESVLDLGEAGSFDEHGLVRPTVVYDAASSTPFRMWYGGVGRDSGAIGYATSLDGHTWTKHQDSSGTPQPVLTPGVFGSADGYSVGEPSVSYDRITKMFRMWYAAAPSRDVKGRAVGFATSTDTTEDAHGAYWSKGGLVSISGSGGNYSGGWFSPGAWFESAPPNHRMVFAGKKSANQPYKLIFADSPNGLTWSAGTIVLNPGSAGSWDANNVFWASIVPDPVGTLYRIYYTGSGGIGDRARNAIGYAPWSGSGGAGTSSRILTATDPGSRFDTNQSAQGAVWQNPEDENLYMFYAGRSASDMKWRIGAATSTVEASEWNAIDGTGDPSTKAVFALGGAGSFDEQGALSASVAALDNSATALAMAYEGVDGAGVSSIGIATGTPATLGSWTRPVSAALSKSAGGFDSVGVGHPSLVRANGELRLYYAGFDGTDWEIGVATATAPAGPWRRQSSAVMTVGAPADCDAHGASDPVVAYDPTSATPYRMWYTAQDALGVVRVAYATSLDGFVWTKHGLTVVPSGEPWSFDEIGTRAGGVWQDPQSKAWHLFYDGIDRGNLGNSAGNPRVNWRRIGHATGAEAGYVSNGSGTYGLVPTGVPAPGYKYDFRDFAWDSVVPEGTSARLEVSFYPAYIMANGVPVDDWSPYVPIDGDTKPMLPLTTEKIRWRVLLERGSNVPTVTPSLDEMRVTWAPVHFETTGTAVSIPVGPTAGKYVDKWTSLDVSTDAFSANTSATVTVLDTYGRTLLGPVGLTGTSSSVDLSGVDPGVQQLRVRFDLEGDGLDTPYVRNWRVNYVSTVRAPVKFFQAFGKNAGAEVTWTEPEYEGLQSTKVLRRLDQFPAGPNDTAATVVYEESATAGARRSFEETQLVNGQVAYYTAYTSDGAGWSPPARTIALPRAPLASLTAIAKSLSVDLQWPLPTASEATYRGVTIVRRISADPLGPADPEAVTIARDLTATSKISDVGVRPGSVLHYAAYLHDSLVVGGIYYDAYTVPATAVAVPLWEAPLYFDAMGYSGSAFLSARVPTSGNATSTVVIVKNTVKVPTSPNDGTKIYDRVVSAGQEITCTVTGLTNMKPVWFAAFVIAPTSEGNPLTSPAAKAAALPRTTRLSGFKAIAGDTRVTAAWNRPSFFSYSSTAYSYAYGGVRVIRGAGAYPANVMDPSAKVLVAGSKTLSSVIDSGLTNLTPYGYRGYAGVRIAKGNEVDYDYGVPSSAMATPRFTTSHTMRCLSYKKYARPYYYYPYGRSIVMSGVVTPNHARLASGARGYVTAYVYKRKYNSRTRRYYWALVKKTNVYLTSTSTWKYSYRGARGIYMVKGYFAGDGNHLPAWSTTRYARVY